MGDITHLCNTFHELLDATADIWKYSNAIQKIRSNPELAAKLETFFSQNGFNRLSALNSGSDSVVFKDVVAPHEKPKIVFRLSPATELRPVIPHIIQPIFSTTIGDIKLEILPDISLDRISPANKVKEMRRFYRETLRYEDGLNTNNLEQDVGAFTYEEPRKPGHFKTVVMGTDAGLIAYDPARVPECASDYPSLEIQSREQKKIVDADPRLQKLLEKHPQKKLPITKIIPFLGIE